MRTKIEKNNKTTVEQNHISIACPKVVLNASDCARLLDSSGKAYVLLVEKDGKMVAANLRSPVQSSPATSSSSPASSEPSVSSSATSSGHSAASQSKICKNIVTVSPAECSKPADCSEPAEYSKSAECSKPADCSEPADCSKPADCRDHPKCSKLAEYSRSAECRKPDGSEPAEVSDTALVERLGINNPHSSPRDQEKSIHTKVILKPPKKRKGIHRKFENASAAALAFDTISQSAVTSVGIAPDVCCVPTDASLSSPLSSSSLDGARKHSIEHLLWHQSASSISNNQSLISGNYPHESQTLILSQNDLPSLSVKTVPFSLSTSSSPSGISTSYVDETQSHLSELYSHSYSSVHHPVANQTLTCQTSVTKHSGRIISREPAPPLPVSGLLSASQIATQPGCFHQLPEQLEPMNLSTSCKSQAHISSGLASQTSDGAPVVVSSQDSQSLAVSEGRMSEVLQNTHEETTTVNLKDTLLDVSQTVPPHPSSSSDISILNHSVHNSAIDLVISVEREEKEADPGSRQLDSPATSQTLSQSVSLSSVQQNKLTAETSVQHTETSGCSLLDQSTASILKFSHSSRNGSSMSEQSSSLDCQTIDIQKCATSLSEACQESSASMEKEATSKTKRSPKKRVEIPMDDKSRDDRINRYSVTIDDVIANFVYVPEPLEEYSLTEEEEAAIRDQFETIPSTSSKVHTDINANQSKREHVVNKTDAIDQTGLHIQDDKLSTSNEMLNLITYSNKCPNSIATAKDTADQCQDVHATVENIDSVLAFVAGDVFNSVSQVSTVIQNSDTKKQTKTVRKLKKVGEVVHKNGKENKILTPGAALEREGSLCVTNSKQELGSAESEKMDVLASDNTSDNGQVGQDTNVISKPRKNKKKKSIVGVCCQPVEPSLLVQSDAASDKSAEVEANDDLSPAVAVLPNTKKHAEGSLKVNKKRKSSGRGTVFTADSVAGQSEISADKDIVGLSRAETSDIGESLASTSGGSEQDTPVHELESKDELVSADMQATENRDTGLESEEDANKPVRRYKKRLDFVKCDHCDHQSRGRSALSRHMKKVHMLDVNMPFKCQHCEYGCTKMGSLNRHLFTHGVFPCSRCSHVADDRIKLTQHVIEEHKDKMNMKLCKMCNRYIKCEQSTIEQHMQQCQGPTPFRCTECEKVFRYASSLRVHYHTHFPNQPKRFRCEQCHYNTNYKANLHKHHKNMHACRDRDVQCPDCCKLFSTEDNMRRHRKVHTLVRPFACQTCEKTFKTQGALRGHQLIHTAIRPYMCNISGCNRSFRTSKFMKNHQEEFHRLAPKKFFCTVEGCNYSFFKRSHLKRHAITHTGERNFHCAWPGCCKSFRHSDNLKVHFRAHTNDKPIRCHLCDFKCKQVNSLFWHKKKVHHVFDIMAYPKRTDHKLAETGNAPKTVDTHCSQATPVTGVLQSAEEGSGQDLPVTEASEQGVLDSQVAPESIKSQSNVCPSEILPVVSEKVASSLRVEACDEATGNTESILGEAEKKDSSFARTVEAKLASCDQSVGTQTVTRERGLLDLYEFKSEDESDEETPGHFRRDKNMLTALTPLPPPPKELLHRIELQEMREKEKREKAEKKELEKKEKAEKKDQERKEKVEKKELEKKEKAERKELEKIERIREKALKRKEKLEKKELEKKEKEEHKLSEKKEKIEKMEMEKKDKVNKKELEKKEKLKRKEQERKEKLERKEQERQEKIEKKEQEKKEKKVNKMEKNEKEKQLEVNKVTTEKLNNIRKKKNSAEKRLSSEEREVFGNSAIKKSPKRLQRKKSPVSATKSDSLVRTEMHTRSKRKLKTSDSDVSRDENDDQRPEESPDKGISAPKKRKVATRRIEESVPVSSPRVTAVAKATNIKRNAPAEVKRKGKLPLPKRKPSARIKAKKKATLNSVKEVRKSPKASKITLRNKPGRKKIASQQKEMNEVKQENEAEVEEKVEDIVVDRVLEEKEVPAAARQEEKETVILPEKPLSPAYSEEMMLQGSASPYRGLSDAENLEDDETEVDESLDQSPASVLSQEQSQVQNKSEIESDLLASDKTDNFTVDRNISQPVDDYSDNEVSNDIPLTPPRAPAPPPVESSEDEMEPEPEPTPFSVPGPTTPFSVPGPNTPFSVPPPTNLMQQHSVHSEETPVSALPSVASLEVHSQASVDMQQPLGSVEMHPHGSVELSHPHGSAEMHHSQGSVEMSHSHSSVEMVQSLNSLEVQHPHRSVSESLSHSEQNLSSIRTPESVIRDSNSNSMSEKYDLLPQSLQEQVQTSDADKEYFDQYLKSLSAANNRAANGGLGPSPSGLQQLEAMVCKSHLESREINSKSPMSSLPISVITSLENTLSLLPHGDLRSRMDALVSDRHESLYARDTPSSLARIPDHQTPLANHPCPTPSYDTFSSLNPLHSAAANSSRDSSYLRQPEKLFPTPPGSSSFMAEAMFQRQAMTTPFLSPHSDKSSLSRVPDTSHLRSSSSSSLLRRPGTVPGSDMFSSPAITQAVPRHPFANTWAGQEMRPAHWQPPYLPRQPNMATTGSFFPTKDSYLTGRNFMFDPSIRPAADRNMFSSLSSTQSQDSFQLDRFDLSNYFPNAMTPYASSAGSFDYSRSVHTAATKPFDDRYRQTSSAAISDYRGLPSSSGSADMFPGLPSVNSSFNIYSGNPMSYHTQHMPENVNSAFLAHSTTAQHAMFERDYAGTAHRGLYPQNTPYSFLDERQYPGASKLAHAHPVTPAAVPQERNIMSRSATADSQMQEPYRSMLYRY